MIGRRSWSTCIFDASPRSRSWGSCEGHLGSYACVFCQRPKPNDAAPEDNRSKSETWPYHGNCGGVVVTADLALQGRIVNRSGGHGCRGQPLELRLDQRVAHGPAPGCEGGRESQGLVSNQPRAKKRVSNPVCVSRQHTDSHQACQENGSSCAVAPLPRWAQVGCLVAKVHVVSPALTSAVPTWQPTGSAARSA